MTSIKKPSWLQDLEGSSEPIIVLQDDLVGVRSGHPLTTHLDQTMKRWYPILTSICLRKRLKIISEYKRS